MLKAYYTLTKPGIIYGNLLNTAAGFLLAAALVEHFDLWLFVATLIGVALVIASACVVNNYTDRGLDVKMTRTKGRASVTGAVPTAHGIVYAVLLGAAGFVTLALFTPSLTVWLGAIAYSVYVLLYAWGKRRTVHGTLVGSIAGALPPIAGYCAVTGTFDSGAAILLFIFALWQMPHFYAIAMYRQAEYAAAALPVLPLKFGMLAAKRAVLLYIGAFTLAAAALTVAGYTGYAYLIVVALAGLAWLRYGLRTWGIPDKRWGRSMFLASLKVILVLDTALAIGALLP